MIHRQDESAQQKLNPQIHQKKQNIFLVFLLTVAAKNLK
jgi:hypothetical protein